jgi:hypothetical protein
MLDLSGHDPFKMIITQKFLHYIHKCPEYAAHFSILLQTTVSFVKLRLGAELHEYRLICFINHTLT